MKVVAVLLVGGGAYLIYYAVEHKTAGKKGTGPLAHAQTQAKKLGKAPSSG